jgi:oligoribonuclease NrnB/cAMP/cGMP phosphodiesterase (DHH superfamily)
MSDTVIVKSNVLNALQSAEIIALKERIKRLEEDLMDAKNKHSVLVADVVLYEDRGERIKRLEEENDAMRADLLLWRDTKP